VRQVGYLQDLYQDARLAEYKNSMTYSSELSFAAIEAGKVNGQECCRAQFGIIQTLYLLKTQEWNSQLFGENLEVRRKRLHIKSSSR
jgi:hypothetical protein